MSYEEHKKHRYSLKIGVITVSSTRNKENDESGKILRGEIIQHGHTLCSYNLVKDDKIEILTSLFSMIQNCDAVILNGGTGISTKDVTYESVTPLLDKELPGFGEIFRHVSYGEIGTAAIMSRATAGIIVINSYFSFPVLQML